MTLHAGVTQLRVAHLNHPVVFAGAGICRRGVLLPCGRSILWARTARGRPIALDPMPNAHGYYVAHEATCPHARQRRRRTVRR